MFRQDQRPVFLNPLQIRLPVNALVSILHRISGMVMFISLPWILFLLSQSLASASSYQSLQQWLFTTNYRCLFYLILLAWVYHALAGFRHLCMDMGWGESLCASRFTAMLVLVLTLALALILGVWLW